MAIKSESIAPGFDSRLRGERKRLNMTQAEFAAMGGVQRLAQGQYESGSRLPNLTYLAAIASGGANLYYLLFGQTSLGNTLSPKQKRDAEKRVFEAVENYVKLRCDGELSPDGRFVLFELWRDHLFTALEAGQDIDIEIANLLTGTGGRHG